MKVPTVIKTCYNMAEIRSLIDSGVTDNFMHPCFIWQMELGTTRLQKPKKLHNVNDTTSKLGEITHCLHLDIQTNRIHKEMHFLVADIGQEDIILGYPWLVEYGPKFSWQHGTLDNQYQPVILTSICPTPEQHQITQLDDANK